MNIIEIKNVSKQYVSKDEKKAVNNISLNIKKGEFVTLLGPSGCGKTTLLRMIAGFEKPTDGEIILNGQNVVNIPPYLRSINTVFQKYALFPNLNVFGNIAFGLKLKKIPVTKKDKDGKDNQSFTYYSKEDISKRVKSALKMVGLTDYESRDVTSLSGGQQQRVAIARAIVNEPQVLLLDEPLGALDLKMRKEMQLELKEMHAKLGITFIYVTHDQEEALTMSDTIVVMKDGVIQQIGTPTDIYNNPQNAFVADFIGESNIFDCTVIDKNTVKFGNCEIPCDTKAFKLKEDIEIVIRPEDIYILEKGKEGHFEGKISSVIFKGDYYEYTVKSNDGYEIIVHETSKWNAEENVTLFIKPTDVQLMKLQRPCNKLLCKFIDNFHIEIDGGSFEVDPTKYISNSSLNDNGDLVDENGSSVTLAGTEVIAEIEFEHIELFDHELDGVIGANVETLLFKGNHYHLEIRTDARQPLYVDTNLSWDISDRVGVKIDKDNIKLFAV